MPLFIIEMRSTMLVAEGEGLDGVGAMANLRGFDIAGHAMDPVAANLFVVDQFDCGPGRHMVEVVAARESFLKTVDDGLRDMLLDRGVVEAVPANLERETDGTDGIANGLAIGLDDAAAQR